MKKLFDWNDEAQERVLEQAARQRKAAQKSREERKHARVQYKREKKA